MCVGESYDVVIVVAVVGVDIALGKGWNDNQNQIYSPNQFSSTFSLYSSPSSSY